MCSAKFRKCGALGYLMKGVYTPVAAHTR